MKNPEWCVTKVQPRDDYTLLVDFEDGSRKVFDVKPLLDRMIYAKLKSKEIFMKAHVFGDTVAWDDDTDIAPEKLYSQGVAI